MPYAPAGAKAPAAAAATIAAAATWPDFSDGNLGPDSTDENLGPDSTATLGLTSQMATLGLTSQMSTMGLTPVESPWGVDLAWQTGLDPRGTHYGMQSRPWGLGQLGFGPWARSLGQAHSAQGRVPRPWDL